jgi:magnesium-transporting ATPase (P-type)
MQKIREEAERIQKEFEEYQRQKALAAKKMRKIAQPFLLALFFILEVYLVKLLILAINSISYCFYESNWFFFAYWIFLGLLATALNICLPIVIIWLFKRTKIFKHKKK